MKRVTRRHLVVLVNKDLGPRGSTDPRGVQGVNLS